MEFWDGQIDFTIDPKMLENKSLNKKENENENKDENKEKYMFNIIDDIDSIDHLPGKAVGNGVMEFSQTKHWNKTIDEIEIEDKKQDQILASLKSIEEILNNIYNLISNEKALLPWWKKLLK